MEVRGQPEESVVSNGGSQGLNSGSEVSLGIQALTGEPSHEPCVSLLSPFCAQSLVYPTWAMRSQEKLVGRNLR